MNNRDRRILCFLATLCFLVYLPQFAGLFFASWPFDDDGVSLFNIWRGFARDSLQRGILPLWNPHLFCGMPFLANNQVAVFYPPNLVYWLLPMPTALLADAIGHNLLLAFGAYALARTLGLSRSAAFVVAVVLGYGGAVAAHINNGHMTWHAVRAYLPWELWALLSYLRSGKLRYAGALSGFLSLQIAAGYPPVVLLSVALCCGLFIAWCATHWPKRDTAPRAALLPRGWPAAALLICVLPLMLTAVCILPMLEVSRSTAHGSGLEFADVSRFSATWRTFLRLVAPRFFGNNSELQWSVRSVPHEEVGYVGLLPLVLALGAPLLARRRNPQSAIANPQWHAPSAVPWLWALLPLAVILALGRETPVYRWLYDFVLPFRLIRVPVRWLEVWYFAAALLAGFAFDSCIHQASRGHTMGQPLVRAVLFALRSISVLFMLLAAAVFMTSPHSNLWMRYTQRFLPEHTWQLRVQIAEYQHLQTSWECATTALLAFLLAMAWAALHRSHAPRQRRWAELLLVGLIVADVMAQFWGSARVVPVAQYRAHVSWPAPIVRAYSPQQRWDTNVSGYAINQGMRDGIDLYNGYDALGAKRFYDFAGAVEGELSWTAMYQPRTRSSLLRVAGVTHTLTSKPQALEARSSWRGSLRPALAMRAGDWQLWRYAGAWPRLYLTTRVREAAQGQQLNLLQRLAARPVGRSQQTVVVAPGVFPEIAANPLRRHGGDLAWRRATNRVMVQTDAGAPAVLVLGEAWFPGWRAWVNGQPEPVEQANFLFRAVRVPAHQANVTLLYEPQTYRFSLFLSLCGLATATALVTCRLRHQLRRRPQPDKRPGGDQPR